MADRTVHEGRNVMRIRNILGIKQETLAAELNLTQQAISALEQKEKIDPKILEDVAKALKVPVEAIRNFDEENTINFISSTFNHSGLFNYNCSLTFNPVEKVVELYERMLREKDELITRLTRK